MPADITSNLARTAEDIVGVLERAFCIGDDGEASSEGIRRGWLAGWLAGENKKETMAGLQPCVLYICTQTDRHTDSQSDIQTVSQTALYRRNTSRRCVSDVTCCKDAVLLLQRGMEWESVL